ncbi:MAG: hydrogenase maturation nickel metallochaperone HypA [Clostridia bacterium]|nr:hydrogenase maturation nickel metallochaperone HypA [Clostridia bacterium]
MKCPQCGYEVKAKDAVRCPRCYKILLVPGCSGNCGQCNQGQGMKNIFCK